MPGHSRRGIPIVLIGGRSGAGKSVLARALADVWPDADVIRLDDIYPGWDGLEAGSRHILDEVLTPLAVGGPAKWQSWDWAAGEPAEWHTVDPAKPLIIEGSGALSRANRALASFGVWVELDPAIRKARALARDGAAYAAYWERWAAQEEVFIRRERPEALADLIVDATAPFETALAGLLSLDPPMVLVVRRRVKPRMPV